MRKLKRLDHVVRSDDLHPWRLTERSILVQSFVHNIPGIYLSLVSTHNGLNVVVQTLQQGLARKRITLVILEDPVRRLRVPAQSVADDEHVMLQAEVDILIRLREVVGVRPGMNDLPLQHILWTDGVELLEMIVVPRVSLPVN